MKRKPENIKLYNRDNVDMWLVYNTDEDYYYLVSNLYLYIKYIRVIFDKDNITIHAIDPLGGPFISVGDIFKTGMGNLKLTKIGGNACCGGYKYYLEYVEEN